MKYTAFPLHAYNIQKNGQYDFTFRKVLSSCKFTTSMRSLHIQSFFKLTTEVDMNPLMFLCLILSRQTIHEVLYV